MFGVERALVPISFVAVTVATTRSPSANAKGEALKLLMDTVQKRLAIVVASAPSHEGSDAKVWPSDVKMTIEYD